VIRAYVGVTDKDWYKLLAGSPGIDEVNFWQPGGNRLFSALVPGELFLFKLHSPENFIVGGGLFSYSTLLPTSLVWQAFGEKNGARSQAEMRSRIERLRKRIGSRYDDFTIGNILLTQPFFFAKDAWIPVPADWKSNIVSGRRYDLTIEPGLSLWKDIQARVVGGWASGQITETVPRYGDPVLIRPRLGQGTFRVQVTDAYARRCAVTGERTLPVLEASHIRPYSEGGQHEVSNGILFRSDIHTLFDQGYVTVAPGGRFEVSCRIREDFENGRDYYRLAGTRLILPDDPAKRPNDQTLRWHNEAKFLR
jgi:putative restriction endonuclease